MLKKFFTDFVIYSIKERKKKSFGKKRENEKIEKIEIKKSHRTEYDGPCC